MNAFGGSALEADIERVLISADAMPRIRRPNARFLATVMCGYSA